ncbi:MAG: hypothetical protein IKR36_01770 [Clostridia bacterium]|nr:hypothetical protein [Clostridia bacterium]
MKKLREKWRNALLRPAIYAFSVRFLAALAVILVVNYLVGKNTPRFLGLSFLLLALLFVALAWIAYLRMDGVTLPKPLMTRVNLRKKPKRQYGDMIDYIDEKPGPTFEELEDQEKDLCLLLADAACCVIYLVLSFFF